MQQVKFLLTSLGLALLLSVTGTTREAYSGTAYNTDDVSDVESAVAAADLQRGLSEFHLMLSSLETSSLGTATQHKMNATSRLNEAVSGFNAVVQLESGNVALSLASDEYSQLSELLRFLDISVPSTRTELAHLAVVMTSQFRDMLSDLAIDDLNSIQPQIHALINMSLLLQDIGVHASRVWSAQ